MVWGSDVRLEKQNRDYLETHTWRGKAAGKDEGKGKR